MNETKKSKFVRLLSPRPHYSCCRIKDFSKTVATVSVDMLEIHEILLSSLKGHGHEDFADFW